MCDDQSQSKENTKIIEAMLELRRGIAEEEREKEENLAKINEFQTRNEDLDTIINEKKTLLMDYGKIRYTDSLLDELIAKEVMESKKMNLIRLKEELMKGDITAEKVMELLRLDTTVLSFLQVIQKESFLSKIGKNFSKRGW